MICRTARVFGVVSLLATPAAAQAGEIIFDRFASPEEMAVIVRDAAPLLETAAKAQMPVTVWVGTNGTVTAFRIESQAICGSGVNGEGAMSSCPTLVVYQGGADRPPIWQGMAGESLKWPQE